MVMERRAVVTGNAASTRRLGILDAGTKQGARRVIRPGQEGFREMVSEIGRHREKQEDRQASPQYLVFEPAWSKKRIHICERLPAAGNVSFLPELSLSSNSQSDAAPTGSVARPGGRGNFICASTRQLPAGFARAAALRAASGPSSAAFAIHPRPGLGNV